MNYISLGNPFFTPQSMQAAKAVAEKERARKERARKEDIARYRAEQQRQQSKGGMSLYNGIKNNTLKSSASKTGLLIAGGVGVVLLGAFLVSAKKEKK